MLWGYNTVDSSMGVVNMERLDGPLFRRTAERFRSIFGAADACIDAKLQRQTVCGKFGGDALKNAGAQKSGCFAKAVIDQIDFHGERPSRINVYGKSEKRSRFFHRHLCAGGNGGDPFFDGGILWEA